MGAREEIPPPPPSPQVSSVSLATRKASKDRQIGSQSDVNLNKKIKAHWFQLCIQFLTQPVLADSPQWEQPAPHSDPATHVM